MARLETQTAFARLAGVSKMAISKACGTKLRDACVGGRIDIDHPAAVAYLASKGRAAPPPPGDGPEPTEARPAPSEPPPEAPRAPTLLPPGPAKRAPAAPSRAPAIPRTHDDLTSVDITSLVHLTLGELTDRYGTVVGCEGWLKARKTIGEIQALEIKNAENEGRLIERELVATHVFGAIEAANLRILSDAPKTIARRLYAAAKAGMSIEEAEGVVRGILSDLLRPVKTKAARALRDG